MPVAAGKTTSCQVNAVEWGAEICVEINWNVSVGTGRSCCPMANQLK